MEEIWRLYERLTMEDSEKLLLFFGPSAFFIP